jgi:hypothetical protein
MSQVVEFLKAGTTTYTVPAGCTSIKFTAIGAGGKSSTGAGGSGGVIIVSTMAVTPGEVLVITVDAVGGTATTSVNSPHYDRTVMAGYGYNASGTTPGAAASNSSIYPRTVDYNVYNSAKGTTTNGSAAGSGTTGSYSGAAVPALPTSWTSSTGETLQRSAFGFGANKASSVGGNGLIVAEYTLPDPPKFDGGGFEDNDLLLSDAVVPVKADASLLTENDVLSADSAVVIKADATITTDDDVAVGASSLLIKADASIAEADDILVSSSQELVKADANLLTEDDTLVSVGKVLIGAMLNAPGSGGDVGSGDASVRVKSIGSMLEDSDIVQGSAQLLVPWTPTQLGSALIGWFDSADTATMVFDTDGAKLLQWNNKGVGGFNLTPATAGRGPSYNATGRNGYPAIMFNSNTQMTAQATTMPSGAQPVVILAGGEFTTTGYRSLFNQGTTNVRAIGIANNGNAYISNKSGSNTVSAVSWNSKDVLAIASWDSAGQYLNINGSSGTLSRLVPYPVDTQLVTVGGYSATDTTGLNGPLQQLVIVAGALTDDLRIMLSGWYAWATGLQALLPTDHPYKTVRPMVAASASAAATANSSFTEANDTASGSGSVRLQISSSIALGDDTIVSSTGVKVQANASLVEADDVALGLTLARVTASGTMLVSDDTLTGSLIAKVQATGLIAEADDTLIGALPSRFTFNADICEEADGFVGSAKVVVLTQASIIEDNDILSSVSTELVYANGLMQLEDDIASGDVTYPIMAYCAFTLENDTVTASVVAYDKVDSIISLEDDVYVSDAKVRIGVDADLLSEVVSGGGALVGAPQVIREADDVVTGYYILYKPTITPSGRIVKPESASRTVKPEYGSGRLIKVS